MLLVLPHEPACCSGPAGLQSQLLCCRAQWGTAGGAMLWRRKMSIGHELSFSPCLLFDSRAEPVSPDVPWQNAYYDEIRLALFMAVSFIRSQGSQSNQEPWGGVFENSKHSGQKHRRLLCKYAMYFICHLNLFLIERGLIEAEK